MMMMMMMCGVKPAFHDTDTNTDTDILARIPADTSDTRDFLKLFLWQAKRHACRKDVGEDVGVGVGVVECGINITCQKLAGSNLGRSASR